MQAVSHLIIFGFKNEYPKEPKPGTIGDPYSFHAAQVCLASFRYLRALCSSLYALYTNN